MTHDTANNSSGGEAGSRDEDNPRTYAACLAAYNNGRLHGRWIDATQDPGDIQAGIGAMLAASPVPGAEEWAIQAYEGYQDARLEEYAGIEKARALAPSTSSTAGSVRSCWSTSAATWTRPKPLSRTTQASTAALPISRGR